MLAVIKPTEAKGVKNVQAAVEEWEANITRLEEEYGETLSDNVKIAILVSLVPDEVKDRVYEIEKGNDEVTYNMAKEVAVSVALRRAEQRKPKEDEVLAVERWGGLRRGLG